MRRCRLLCDRRRNMRVRIPFSSQSRAYGVPMTQAFYGKTQKIQHAQIWALSSAWLERQFCTLEVMGSNPIGSTKSFQCFELRWRIKTGMCKQPKLDRLVAKWPCSGLLIRRRGFESRRADQLNLSPRPLINVQRQTKAVMRAWTMVTSFK